MSNTVLYFGSYNPVHKGHIAIAEYVAAHGYGEVWMVVSPRNPLKTAGSLAADIDRLKMVEIAVENSKNPLISACGIEFELEKPSYTIDTMRELAHRYPDRKFSLLIGADILEQLDRWKEYETLLENYTLLVYPRKGAGGSDKFAERIVMLQDAPLFPYSSTDVRERLAKGEDCSAMLDEQVYNYIKKNNLWHSNHPFKTK